MSSLDDLNYCGLNDYCYVKDCHPKFSFINGVAKKQHGKFNNLIM
jgi:hypothetical protein